MRFICVHTQFQWPLYYLPFRLQGKDQGRKLLWG